MKNPLRTWFLTLHNLFLCQKRYNINQLQKFEAVLANNGYSLRQFKSVLDFACGYGRLTKHLFRLIPEAEIYGCDIQSDLVSLCKRNFPKGYFIKNEVKPPLDYADSHFDMIF